MLHRLRTDRGAAAVEFAFIAPVLVLLVVGIAEFGRAYNVQNSLSAAAREGVRVMAIKNDATMAQDAAINAAPSVALARGDVAVSSLCHPGADATVTITYQFTMLTGLLGPNLTLTGTGVMRCGG